MEPSVNRFDKLDALIKLSCEPCMDDEVDEFYNQKIEHHMSEKAYRKILRMIRKYDRARKFAPYKRPLLIAAFAVMLAITMLFVACVSIPRVRKALWKAITEWHDDYISVKFVPNDDEESTTGTTERTNPTTEPGTDEPDKTSATTEKPDDPPVVHVDPPKTIEEINAPTYVPNGYSVEDTKTENMYMATYWIGDDLGYTFMEVTYSSIDSIYVDSVGATLTTKIISNIEFAIFSYEDNSYAVVWQDSKYAYSLYGNFDSFQTLMIIVNSFNAL